MTIKFGIFWKRKDIVENELKNILNRDKEELRKTDGNKVDIENLEKTVINLSPL